MKADLIRRFCDEHPAAVLFDEASQTLSDVFSGKRLRIDLSQLRDVIERTEGEGGARYLLLVFESGQQLALARQGIAFPPDARNSGPLPGIPQVVCFRDLASVAAQIDHTLSAHPDEVPGREVLDMILYCIALLDGGRAAGFEVGEEERRIEGYLDEVERRRGTR